jgi:hypothetical protein
MMQPLLDRFMDEGHMSGKYGDWFTRYSTTSSQFGRSGSSIPLPGNLRYLFSDIDFHDSWKWQWGIFFRLNPRS